MKKSILLILIIALFFLPACSTRLSNINPSSISDSETLEIYMDEGISLDDVYGLMSSDYRHRTILYPAQNIYQDNKIWHFTAMEIGEPGDINAPYHALICMPEGKITNPYYIIFFRDKLVMGDAWFDWETATKIEKLLWTTESTD